MQKLHQLLQRITSFVLWIINATGLMMKKKKVPFQPISVNYHFTRKCNYQCGFCFHTQKSSNILPLERAKEGLRMLKEAGMKKLNFAGGEPFLYPEFLGELVRYCREELQLESVSIVSNGSKITEKWFVKYGQYLDILAISCDSFNEETNRLIGRGRGNHLKALKNAKELCDHYNVKFKMNTVVNAYNWQEDMNAQIEELAPFRWKVFQVLALEGENTGEGALRDVTRFLISKEQFEAFLERHKKQTCLVPESNEAMQNSYILLDENMCFLDCSSQGKVPSASIFEVGVAEALKQSGFDGEMFQKRGGQYDWFNRIEPATATGCSSLNKELLDW